AAGKKSPVYTLDGCLGGAPKVVFSHNAQFLASGGGGGRQGGQLKVWDTTTWQERLVLLKGGAPAAFSADGKYLATCSSFTIQLRDATTGEEIRTLRGHRWAIFDVAFDPNPDVPRLASASADGTVRIWDVKTGEEVVAPL